MPANTDDNAVLEVLNRGGLDHTATRPIEPSLEDVFVTLTRSLAKK